MKKGKLRKGTANVWRKPQLSPLWVAVREGGFLFLSPCNYGDDAKTDPNAGSSPRPRLPCFLGNPRHL